MDERANQARTPERPRLRVGVFGRGTAPTDGGSDTLLRAQFEALAARQRDRALELVPIPWSAWSHRRRPLRYLWSRVVRSFGSEIPLVDLRPVCRRYRLDLAYFAAPAFARIDLPYVFTLWDLGHRTIPEFPEMRSGRDPWTHREALCRQMLGQASYVVVGNETGAVEVRTFFGLPASRVVAVPFPNPDFSTVVEEVPAWLPPRPFFLYPAQFWPHKNHATLLRAIAHLAAAGRAIPDLVFTGADKGNAPWVKACALDRGVADRVHFAGFVSRPVLKALYRRATGLAFPSLLGPNNLPLQEAAVLGCPAIVSDLPGHREQLGDGADYVDPLDEEAWAEAMLRLVERPERRTALATRAAAAVAGCTASAHAERIGALLARLAKRRSLWGDPGCIS